MDLSLNSVLKRVTIIVSPKFSGSSTFLDSPVATFKKKPDCDEGVAGSGPASTFPFITKIVPETAVRPFAVHCGVHDGFFESGVILPAAVRPIAGCLGVLSIDLYVSSGARRVDSLVPIIHRATRGVIALVHNNDVTYSRCHVLKIGDNCRPKHQGGRGGVNTEIAARVGVTLCEANPEPLSPSKMDLSAVATETGCYP